MKTSWKPLGRSILLVDTQKKLTAELRRGTKSIEYDERSGRPKEATTDANVEIVHSLVICDRRRNLRDIASETGKSSWASSVNPNRHLRHIQGLVKIGPQNVDRRSEEKEARYF